MKKHVIVKQKNLYSNEKNIMYDGLVSYNNIDAEINLRYIEFHTNAQVEIKAKDGAFYIQRKAEVTSQLCFIPNRKTTNSILSEFGIIEIEIFTHKYIKRENIIAIEYDILQGDEVLEGFRIIWDIKEEAL